MVFSSLDTVELSDEEAGAVDAVFCSALGMSCSWVLARPRLKRNKGRKFFFCFLKEDFFMTHIRALSLITHGEAPEISKYVNVNFRFGNILTLLSKELLDKIFIDNFFVSSKLILVNQHDNVLNVKVK